MSFVSADVIYDAHEEVAKDEDEFQDVLEEQMNQEVKKHKDDVIGAYYLKLENSGSLEPVKIFMVNWKL